MLVLAEITTMNGGVVLEVGFGMAISACFIQERQIAQHIIIEANQGVASRAKQWRPASE